MRVVSLNPYSAPRALPDAKRRSREGGVRPPAKAPEALIVIAVLGFLNYAVQILLVVLSAFVQRSAAFALVVALPGLVGAIGLYRERRWGLVPLGVLVVTLAFAPVFRPALWSAFLIYLVAVPIVMLVTGLRYWRVLD